jgi:hypothetical protein
MVFCSFDPEDLRTDQTSSVGVKHLRAYLEQARAGTPTRVGAQVAVDRHAEQIAAALRAAGCTVQTEVGLSEFRIDLAVAAPGRGEVPTLAVLLDGPAWASRATTGDRDGAPVSVLSSIMGWPGVARVWLPGWLSDPDGVVADLVARAHASAEAQREVGETSASTSWTPDEDSGDQELPTGEEPLVAADQPIEPPLPVDPESDGDIGQDVLEPEEPGPDDDAARDREPGLDVFREQEIGPFPAGVLERLDVDARARREVAALMGTIIEESGPISLERLSRRVVKAYGRTRLVDQRLAQLRALVPDQVRRDRQEGFLWPAARDPRDWTGFRVSQDLKARPLTDVALIEIANAMAHVAAQAMGIGAEELSKQTYRLFGGSRLTEPVRIRLSEALRVGIERGRLVDRAGVITAAR